MPKLLSRNSVALISGLTNSPVLFGSDPAVLLNGEPGESPVVVEEEAPNIPIHSFRFGSAEEDAGGNTAKFDPFNHVNIVGFNGCAILLDGRTLNKEYDGDRVVALEILAPSSAVAVANGAAQTGSDGTYIYKTRFKCSKTGKVSGLSPASTAHTATGYKRDLSNIPESDDDQVDVVQIFRSLDSTSSFFFLLDEVANGTTTYTDDISVNTDEEISQNESSDLVQGRTYNEGRMWPMLKCYPRFGFVYYYGIQRMPKYTPGTVSVTNGSQEVSGAAGCRVRYSRLGQRFAVSGDTQEYSIIDVDEDNNKFFVYPAIERSTASGLSYSITDTRCGGVVEISEARRQGSVPVSHRKYFSSDATENVVLLFSLPTDNGGDSFFAITTKRIVQIRGTREAEPWNSLYLDEVVPEGACGPNAAVVVPGVGLVYVHERLGPRVFDGVRSRYLGGGREETSVSTEWKRVRSANKADIVVRHVTNRNLVTISYARSNDPELFWRLVYSVPYGEWVGIWSGPVFEYGDLLDNDLTPRGIIGDNRGVLFQDGLGTRDGYASGTLEGTISGISGRVITVSGANFQTSGDGLFGSVVEMVSPGLDSTVLGIVVENTADTITLENFPSVVPIAGWTIRISPVSWNVLTGYIDGDDPHHDKTLWAIRLRHSKGGSSTIRAASSVDGGPFYNAESGECQVGGRVYSKFVFRRGGTAFQVFISGTGDAEVVEFTQAVVEIEPRRHEHD